VIPTAVYAQALRLTTPAALALPAGVLTVVPLLTLPIFTGPIIIGGSGMANVPIGVYLVSYGFTYNTLNTSNVTSGLYANGNFLPGTSTLTTRNQITITVSNTSLCNLTVVSLLTIRVTASVAATIPAVGVNGTAAYITVLKVN
jgi:hypothetical protein